MKEAFDIGIKPKKVLNYFCQNMHHAVLLRNREELQKALPLDGAASGKRRKRQKNENLLRLLPDNMIEVVYMWYDDYKLRAGPPER